MKKNVILTLLGAACILAACAKNEVPPAAAQPAPAAPSPLAEAKPALDANTGRMMALLRVVYGERGAHENYLDVELPDQEKRNVMGAYRLEPVAMHVLADGRVAVVANAQMVDANGEAMAYHVTSGLLNVYLLRMDGDKWKVDARHENIASLGSNGTFGEVEWVSLGEGKPGFIVRHGGTWQGSSISLISIFDLTDQAMHDLAGAESLSSDNDGDCGDDRAHCWSGAGRWQFEKRVGSAYDDLVLRFIGHEEDKADGAPEAEARVRRELNGTARYKFDGGRYVLVEGKNIVPGV
jgi:hypothetical protein